MERERVKKREIRESEKWSEREILGCTVCRGGKVAKDVLDLAQWLIGTTKC